MKKWIIAGGLCLGIGTASAGMTVLEPITSSFFLVESPPQQDVLMSRKNLVCDVSNGSGRLDKGKLVLSAGSKLSCKASED